MQTKETAERPAGEWRRGPLLHKPQAGVEAEPVLLEQREAAPEGGRGEQVRRPSTLG